jgi:ELWxxDGT repeat protein
MGMRDVCTGDFGVPDRYLVLEQLEERIVMDGAVADVQDVQDQAADGGQVDSLGWISAGNGWWYEDNGSGWWWEEATGWYWNENTGWWVLNSGDFSYWYHGDHQYWANEISTGAWFWWDDVSNQIWEPAFTWFADQVDGQWTWVYNDWNGSQYYTDEFHSIYQDHYTAQEWWFDSVESQSWEQYQTWFTDTNGILQYNDLDTTTYSYGNGLYTFVQDHVSSGTNDAPQIGVPGTQGATENTDKIIPDIAILDVDAGLNDIQATLSVAHGTLTFAGITGLTFTTGTGNHDASMVFTGTQDAINAALANLTYTGGPAFAGTDSLNITIDDLGNTGTGGQLSSTQSIQIDVADIPSLTGFADIYNLNNPTDILQFSAIQNIVVSDIDSPSVTVSIFVDSGTLVSTSGTFSAGTWTVTDTVANVQTALNNLTYTQVAPGGVVNGTTHVVDSSGNSPADGAFQILINDVPSLTGFSSLYDIHSTDIIHFNGITVLDADPENVTVTLTLSNPLAGVLASTGGTFDPLTGIWTITDSVANVQAAMDALTFTPSGVGTVNVGIEISDAQANSRTYAPFEIVVNDIPGISGFSTVYDIHPTDTILFTGISVFNPDNENVTISLTLSNPMAGVLSSSGGTFDPVTGVWTMTDTAANVQIALNAMTFTPSGNGTVNVTTHIVDDHGNVAPDGVFQVVVNEVPSLTGFLPVYDIHSSDTILFSGIIVTDADPENVTVSVTLSNPLAGVLGSTGGTFDSLTGVWTITDSVANVQAALNAMTFTPNGVGTTTVTTHIVDAHGNFPVADGSFQIVVNDIPSLTGFLSTYSLGGPSQTLPFSGIVVTDPDGENVTVSIQISAGTLASTLGGTFAAGTWAMTGTVANVQAALNALTFLPSGTGYITGTTHIVDAHGNSPADGAFSVTVGGATLLQDINPGTANSSPGSFIEFQNDLYFVASDATGAHLFKLDHLTGVISIVPGSPTAGGYLTIFDGDLYFSGRDATYGTELWKMDGATGAFTRCTDIYGGTGSSYPSQLIVYNNDLYFAASTAANPNPNTELWVYHIDPVSGNGTAQLAVDCWVGSSSGYPGNLTVFNGDLYFSAYDTASNNGNELWRYHADPGQIVGTGTRISNIAAGTASSSPMFLTVFNDSLYFRANSASSIISPANSELWKVDSTGTVSLVNDLWVGGNGDTSYLTVLNGNLYFSGNDGTGVKIWMMTADETFSSLAWAGTASGVVKYLYAFNNDLYFQGYSAAQGYELWKYDDATGTASLIQDIWPGANPNNGLSLTPNFYAFNGDLYFTATDGGTGTGHGYELWKYDPGV